MIIHCYGLEYSFVELIKAISIYILIIAIDNLKRD